MGEILKILRESLPEAIGGITVLIMVSVAGVIWSRLRKRRKRPHFDIYLSYPGVDRDIVKRLVSRLENSGVKVFYDLMIEPGEDFQKILDEELRRASAIGFCITPSTQGAQGVRDEISKAIGREEGTVTLIPIIMPGSAIANIPDPLKRFIAVDLGGGLDDARVSVLVKRLGRV